MNRNWFYEPQPQKVFYCWRQRIKNEEEGGIVTLSFLMRYLLGIIL